MSSTDNPFAENNGANLDMEGPLMNTAMSQEDLQPSSADHSADAGGPAIGFFQQQLTDNNSLVPPVVSNSYPGNAPQSTTTPTSVSTSAQPDSAESRDLSYATMPVS